MSGALVDYVNPDEPSGILIYRRRFPQELVPFIPRANGIGLGRRELRVSLQGFNIDDPGVSERWQQAKAEFERIVTQARSAETIAGKKASGEFDTLTAPIIAYLSEMYRQEALEADHKARWDGDERSLFKGVAAQLAAAGVAAVSPWTGRDGTRWALKTQEVTSAALTTFKAIRANGDQDALVGHWHGEALEFAEDHGYVIDPSADEEVFALCRAFNDAAISTAQDRLKRLGGEEYPETPVEPVVPATGRQASSVPLLDLFDLYAAA